MMIIDVDDAPMIALELLKEKLHEWRDSPSPVWPATWSVFEYLIDLHDEIAPFIGKFPLSISPGNACGFFWNSLFIRVALGQRSATLSCELPQAFKLSDAALATICNITRDLPPDEVIDAAYVKRIRHRLKVQGFSAVW